jgi:hypothetical protein
VPLLKPEDVIPHLGKPTHWKDGRSAKAVAESWFYANDIPASVRALLEQAEEYCGVELIDAWLERCVDLGDGNRPTQTDLMAVLGIGDRLACWPLKRRSMRASGRPLPNGWSMPAMRSVGGCRAWRDCSVWSRLLVLHCATNSFTARPRLFSRRSDTEPETH